MINWKALGIAIGIMMTICVITILFLLFLSLFPFKVGVILGILIVLCFLTCAIYKDLK